MKMSCLLSGFGGRSKNAQILSDISLRLRNADKVEPGNPYVDVPLIEYSGRKENLSGYIGYARYTAIGFWRSDSEPSCRDMTKFGELAQYPHVSIISNLKELVSPPPKYG